MISVLTFTIFSIVLLYSALCILDLVVTALYWACFISVMYVCLVFNRPKCY